MKVLIAPDSFKGSLSSREAAEAVGRSVRNLWPEIRVISRPLADGGEGTVEALEEVLGGGRIKVKVSGPRGQRVEAEYLLAGRTAVLEMAAASGLGLAGSRPDVLRASTFGTGQLLLDACRRADRVILGVGGSATVDGGAGALQALGLDLLDEEGRPIPAGGQGLLSLRTVNAESLDEGVLSAEILVAADVDNPLLGPRGAAPVFGPQKGAGPREVGLLEKALEIFRETTLSETGRDMGDTRFAGAAGGLAGGLWAYLGAQLVQGSGLVCDLVGFDDQAADSSLVITGEGALDETTWNGKVVHQVVQRCRRLGVPVVALCGQVEAEDLAEREGLAGWGSIAPGPASLAESRDQAFRWLEKASYRHLKWIDIGTNLDREE